MAFEGAAEFALRAAELAREVFEQEAAKLSREPLLFEKFLAWKTELSERQVRQALALASLPA